METCQCEQIQENHICLRHLKLHPFFEKLLIRNSLNPFYNLCAGKHVLTSSIPEQLLCTKHCLGPGSPVANIWWWQQSASSLPLCTQTIAPISEPHFFPSTSTKFLIPPNRWNLTDLSETRENVTLILLFSTI